MHDNDFFSKFAELMKEPEGRAAEQVSMSDDLSRILDLQSRTLDLYSNLESRLDMLFDRLALMERALGIDLDVLETMEENNRAQAPESRFDGRGAWMYRKTC